MFAVIIYGQSLKVLVDFEGQGVGLAFLGPLHHLVRVVGDMFAVRRDGVRVQVSPIAGERFTNYVRRGRFFEKDDELWEVA